MTILFSAKTPKSVSSPTLFLNVSHNLLLIFYMSSPRFLYAHFLVLCPIFVPLPSFLHSSLPPLDFVLRVFSVLTHSFALTGCVYIDIRYSVAWPQHCKTSSTEAHTDA